MMNLAGIRVDEEGNKTGVKWNKRGVERSVKELEEAWMKMRSWKT